MPLLDFFGYEGSEIGRRAGKDHAAEGSKLSLQLGIGKASIDFLVKLVDDLAGRFPRDAGSEKTTQFVTRNKFAYAGRSGSACDRASVDTAKARSLPVLMYSINAGKVSKPSCTCRARRSLRAGALPRYCTWTIEIHVFNATTIAEIDTAFAALASERPDALLISSGLLFLNRRVQIAHLATRYTVPAIASPRSYPEAGGLMSYGTSLTDAHRQAGVYTGHILKGAKPADLPVVQSIKFELVINASTARMLGLTVPATLLSIADEVIE